MTSSNEFVTLGHPDSTADAISSYILDRYLEADTKTRYAVECQIKDNNVNLAGEVTSNAKFTLDKIEQYVKEAVREVGYSHEYAQKWPAGTTLDADTIKVNAFIGQQSPDIAKGVDMNGWGDQGVFCGMAVNDLAHGFMPLDRYYSNRIGQELYHLALSGNIPIGLDIKTLVTVDENFVSEVVVAAPMEERNEYAAKAVIEKVVRETIPLGCGPDRITINGTGSYVTHSSVGDSGTTGRKLAVNFYGLSCPIGGGSPWTKDPTKADLTLNLACRYFALKEILTNGELKTCYVKMSCCIGKPEVSIAYFNERWELIRNSIERLYPSDLIGKLGLADPIYFNLCRDGLFSLVDDVALGDHYNLS